MFAKKTYAEDKRVPVPCTGTSEDGLPVITCLDLTDWIFNHVTRDDYLAHIAFDLIDSIIINTALKDTWHRMTVEEQTNTKEMLFLHLRRLPELMEEMEHYVKVVPNDLQ